MRPARAAAAVAQAGMPVFAWKGESLEECKLGAKLTPEQAKCLGISPEGPFKADRYRPRSVEQGFSEFPPAVEDRDYFNAPAAANIDKPVVANEQFAQGRLRLGGFGDSAAGFRESFQALDLPGDRFIEAGGRLGRPVPKVGEQA